MAGSLPEAASVGTASDSQMATEAQRRAPTRKRGNDPRQASRNRRQSVRTYIMVRARYTWKHFPFDHLFQPARVVKVWRLREH